MQDDAEIIRDYTSVRRIPLLFGRFRDGTRLWGGPYTVLQAVTFAFVITAGMFTRPIWGLGNMLGDLMVVAAGTALAVWAAGKVPTSNKNPLWTVVGVGRAVTASSTGQVAGRPLVVRQPRRPRSDPRAVEEARALLATNNISPPGSEPAPPPAPPAPAEPPAPEPVLDLAPASRVAVTGVEHLRAVTATRKE